MSEDARWKANFPVPVEVLLSDRHTGQNALQSVTTVSQEVCVEIYPPAMFHRLWPLPPGERYSEPGVASETAWLHTSHGKPLLPQTGNGRFSAGYAQLKDVHTGPLPVQRRGDDSVTLQRRTVRRRREIIGVIWGRK